MPNLIVLGCAPGKPAPDRNSSAYLVEAGSESLLLDCGEGVSRAFLAAGRNPLAVGFIFLSHTHPDHIAGLPLFVQMMHLLDRKDKLTIYLPEEARSGLKHHFDLCYLFEEKLEFSIQMVPVQAGWSGDFPEFSVRVVPNRHLSGYGGMLPSPRYFNQMQSFSFVLDFKASRFYYSGDLFGLEDLKNLPQGIDLLLVEGLHLPIEPLLAFCAEREVKTVLLTHPDPKGLRKPLKLGGVREKEGLGLPGGLRRDGHRLLTSEAYSRSIIFAFSFQS